MEFGECMYLVNAFSANMLAEFPASVKFVEKTLDEAKALLAAGFISAVGHADTASVFADVLSLGVETKRVTLTLKKGDVAIVGQYRGPRLEEGAKHLPEGATIQWLLITID